MLDNEQEKEEIKQYAPQKLMGSFSKNRIIFCTVLALIFHAVVIGGTSVDYIYYNWINPTAGEARERRLREEREGQDREKQEALEKTQEEAAAEETEKEETQTDETVSTHDELMEKHRDAPVVKRVTEKASEEETPEMPDDLNLSIDDTGF
ncbi:MAG: hypothetical protein R6V03_07915 [Kiritimatiellia bacterium]